MYLLVLLMAGPRAVEELVSSVRSNIEVIRDAMKEPMTNDSHAIVSEMMLDIKQSQELLQKKASEMVESGNFSNTSEIFETIDLVTNMEPIFEEWTHGGASASASGGLGDTIGASIHVDVPKKKKKKKKNRNEDDWEAFPPPPGGAWPAPVSPSVIPREGTTVDPVVNMQAPKVESGRVSIQAPVMSIQAPVVESGRVSIQAPVMSMQPPMLESGRVNMHGRGAVAQSFVAPGAPAAARLTLGMNWESIAPLLGDPGSTDDVRKSRLAQLIKEAIGSECGIALDRVCIKQIS